MGYFSNGSEGSDYELRWCAHCVHVDDGGDGEGCAVWLAHLQRNYDECNDKASVLHVLIPRTADGLGNERCRLFIDQRTRVRPDLGVQLCLFG